MRDDLGADIVALLTEQTRVIQKLAEQNEASLAELKKSVSGGLAEVANVATRIEAASERRTSGSVTTAIVAAIAAVVVAVTIFTFESARQSDGATAALYGAARVAEVSEPLACEPSSNSILTHRSVNVGNAPM